MFIYLQLILCGKNMVNPAFEREDKNRKIILEFLTGNPRGVTIADVKEKTGVSRETASRHLRALEYENQIYTKMFGNVQVFYLNHRPVRDKDRLPPIEKGNRRLYVNLLENEYGEYVTITEQRKMDNAWKTKGSIMLDVDVVSSLDSALDNLMKRRKQLMTQSS